MNKKIKIFFIILGFILVAMIFIFVNKENMGNFQKSGKGDYILFEKDEGWGPCPTNLECYQRTKIYYSGILILGGQTKLQKQLSKEEINNLISAIKSSGVMNKNCSAPIVLDYSAAYKLVINSQIKVINFPGCENELREIEKLIPVNITERQGGA